jgi:hypothetical protein
MVQKPLSYEMLVESCLSGCLSLAWDGDVLLIDLSRRFQLLESFAVSVDILSPLGCLVLFAFI